jgi:hypothetical protein
MRMQSFSRARAKMGTITSNIKKTIRSALRILATARFFVVMAVSCVSWILLNKLLIEFHFFFNSSMFIVEKPGKGNRRWSDFFIRQGAAGLSDFVLWGKEPQGASHQPQGKKIPLFPPFSKGDDRGHIPSGCATMSG